jgi:hypothetical protein
MSSAKPESPIMIEEILLLHGWVIHFKDAAVCSLVNPKDRKARPICIPQNPGPKGLLSAEIVEYLLFEARIDDALYPVLLARVQAIQEAAKNL